VTTRGALFKGLLAGIGAGALVLGAAPAADAGQKINKQSFGIHSFRQDPGVPAGSIRMNMWPSWRQLNPARGQYNWEVMDATLATVKSWGISDQLFVFGNTPQWAAGKVIWPDRELEPGSTAAPKNMSDWTNFVTAFVQRYKGDLDSYQAWNEITSPQFYQGTAKQMAKMTKILSTVVNKYDPSAEVVSASVQTHAQAYYDRMATPYFAAMQKQGWPVDVIAGHFYPTGKGGPDKRIKQIQMFQKDLARYKAPKSADQWDTEANFWTTVPGEPYAGRVRGAKAATYLARNYLDTWRTGLKRSYWYMWTVGDQDLRFPGVQLRTGDPATTAFQNLGAWTIGAKYKSCTTKGKLVQCSFTKSGKSFVIAFTTKGSATVKANSKQVCPVYGGSCTTGTSKQKVTTLPVKIG